MPPLNPLIYPKNWVAAMGQSRFAMAIGKKRASLATSNHLLGITCHPVRITKEDWTDGYC